MLREFVDVAETEVDLLRRSDRHPNVIRYYCMERDSEFMYIALELCVATLVDVVDGPRVSTRGTRHGIGADAERLRNLDRRDLSRQFLNGLAHLHALGLVHRCAVLCLGGGNKGEGAVSVCLFLCTTRPSPRECVPRRSSRSC